LKLKLEEGEISRKELKSESLKLTRLLKQQEKATRSITGKSSAQTIVIDKLTREKSIYAEKASLLEWENSSLKAELEELREFKQKFEEWGYMCEDWSFWEDMCVEWERRIIELEKANKELLEENARKASQLKLLEDRIKWMVDTQLKNTKWMLDLIDVDFEKASVDDLLRYITYSKSNHCFKQQWADACRDFIDFVIAKTTKWASSSTNRNSHEDTWKWSWMYANKFLNPIMNYLKYIYTNSWTHAFLEQLSALNWIHLIEEYLGENLWKPKSRKDRVINIVYNSFASKGELTAFPISSSLLLLAKVLENTEFWDINLMPLSNNIREAVSESTLRKDLQLIAQSILKSNIKAKIS
jgi:hypothetical protein